MSVDPDLIPVRALNQVSYCPRLYYLEYVESLMPVNEFVEDGLFQHRRVNDPLLENRTRKEGDSLHTRSVSLSSERLGISGKLDLMEERGGQVRPVEYKRSEAPKRDNGQPGYWENDAIQLCAQGLLMEEEFGHPVTHGVLYYIGSKTRVDIVLDEPLRLQTLNAIRLIRDLSARATPPEPLPAEHRHRCPGCSLVTICQPEETLYLIERGEPLSTETPAGPLTRVMPENDDGAVLYVHQQGSYLSKRSEHLVIKYHGEEINRVPIASIRQVVVFGNIQVSTQTLECLATSDVPVVYLTPYGRFVAALMPAPTKNAMLRIDQYRIFSDPERALALARAVVRAKVANQRTLLMRSLRSRPVEGAEDGAEVSGRGSDEPAARDMAELLNRIDRVNDPGVLLGIEGQAASLYFSQFGRMLKSQGPGTPFDFTKRNRRPPRDPVNALLSFAYAILAKDCFSAVCTVGFDPYQGFYHTGKYGRPSLALDLMEEFRSVIADSVVLSLVNNGTVTEKDFLIWRDACQLTAEGRKKFFQTYEQRKSTVVAHPTFGYKMSYGRMLEVQGRMLAAYIRGDVPRYIGFTVR